MLDPIIELFIPFVLAAGIVILISLLAERYGTKIGGIFGTLPSTMVVAFIFIAINRGETFTADAVAVVPAEMGINVIFLCIFTILLSRSLPIALLGSLSVWGVLSTLLLLSNLTNILISLTIFTFSLIGTFFFLEKVKKIPSCGSVTIHHTPLSLLLRGLFAGLVIAIAVVLSNLGAVLSGIFSMFPVIFMSTMIISVKDHGSEFAGGMAKSLIIGSTTVVSYAVAVHVFYPRYLLVWGTALSFLASLIVVVVLLKFRSKIL